MASARTLSTTELGATRYSQAAATNSWPVLVSVRPGPSDTTQTSYKLVIGGIPDTRLRHTKHGDLRATAALPTGSHTYQIYREGQLVYSDEAHVQPGEAPLATTKRASALTERRLSGVTQISDCVEGKACVRFVYAEETHSAREVYGVGEGVEVRLQREESGDFVGDGVMEVGERDIRFRVVPREWTRPDIAPFTRLGWDDCAGERGVLVTWPLRVVVRKAVGKEETDGKEGGNGGALGLVLVGAFVVAALAFAVMGRGREAVEEDGGDGGDGEPEAEPVAELTGNMDTALKLHMRSTSL